MHVEGFEPREPAEDHPLSLITDNEDRKTLARIGLLVVCVTLLTLGLVSASLVFA